MKHDRQCNSPALAAMLRMAGLAYPHWADVFDDAAGRLDSLSTQVKAGPRDTKAAERSRKWREEQRSRALANVSRTAQERVANVSPNVEGGRGVVLDSDAEKPLLESEKASDQKNTAQIALIDIQSAASANVSRARRERRSRTVTNEQLPEGFRRWWAAFPVASRRADATRCVAYWTEQGLEPKADEIIAATARLAELSSWRRDGGKFCPLTTTYLNQKRYEAVSTPSTALPPESESKEQPNGRKPLSDHRAARTAREFAEPNLLDSIPTYRPGAAGAVPGPGRTGS